MNTQFLQKEVAPDMAIRHLVVFEVDGLEISKF
jgi:hypothetical protein